MPEAPRFRDQRISFPGADTREIAVPTANPINYHQAITTPDALEQTSIDAKLFTPKGAPDKLAAVIITPGSLGVAVSHLSHAETITTLGAAALVIDPFGARGVTSTVANQTQYSFAASAYDVLAAMKLLAAMPEIDPARIGAQGHSRGGSAVVNAAMRRFADPVMGAGPRLKAAYAAYPWSGQQFLDPDIGATRLRTVIGERDDWCSPQQVQGHVNAIRLRGGDVSFRLFADACHSFDRETGVEKLPDAVVALGAPTIFLADDGAMVDPVSGEANANTTDRDFMVYAMKAGFGGQGATIGSKADQPAQFKRDMIEFWRGALGL
ncbi:MAG: dienelactone hydrolase family protein [Hyphomonadaceae bacterium]